LACNTLPYKIAALRDAHQDGRFHDVLVCHADPVTMPNLECEAASTYALGLVPDLFHAPAADRYAHLRKPVAEGASCDNEYWPTCADEYWPTPGV
jgi:hypothetical protein